MSLMVGILLTKSTYSSTYCMFIDSDTNIANSLAFLSQHYPIRGLLKGYKPVHLLSVDKTHVLYNRIIYFSYRKSN